MKALSLTQPWANAILHLGKRIENREWRGCSYRGPVLLHAAKGVGTRDEFDGAVETIMNIVGRAMPRERVKELLDVQFVVGGLGIHHADGRWRRNSSMRLGAIVGVANIADTVACDGDGVSVLPPLASGRQMSPRDRPWWFGGFALVLTHVLPVPPIPCKGALGLWNAGPDIVAQLPEWARS